MTDVRREPMAFGMRAEMKRRRWCAPSSSSEYCSCTPEAILVSKGGEERGEGLKEWRSRVTTWQLTLKGLTSVLQQ